MNLRNTISSHASVLLERNTTKAIISDVLNNDFSKVNVLMCAYDIGIVGAIEKQYPLSQLSKTNLINQLVSQFSMKESAATWAVETWQNIMTPALIKDLTVIKQEREKNKIDRIKETMEQGESPQSSLPDTDTKDEDVDHGLSTKDDIVDYYINVQLRKIEGKIFIPCGVGTTDNGFYICGIKETQVSDAPPVFAVVYNYLMRNSTILPEDYPHYMAHIETTYQVNYQRIFRLMIIILQLIKNGAISSKLNIHYDGRQQELKLAIDILNDYIALFSRLIKIKPALLTIGESDKRRVSVSLDRRADVYVENNAYPCNARELWYSEKINYRLTEKDIGDLEYILGEISPFDSFKEGQFIALISMMNTSGHSMCIMPTGSGKSLLFYFASLLQPLPLMVLAPTEILIDDQIRNLKKFHHMDNVSHLRLTEDNDFSAFYPCTSLMYLTPSTFQSVNLLKKCRHINNGYILKRDRETMPLHEVKVAPGPSLAYVVLDEVHCLSNWGHDFRPEYLTLSKYLNKYLSRINFLTFTATANYAVVEDIQAQLNIPQQNIFSPIIFEKYNISYDFRVVPTTADMFSTTCEIVADALRRGERTLIFTKNDDISTRLAETIGYEADVFQRENLSAYRMFAEEKCNVLVASEDMGIGINLPHIQNVIHFGLPISKNEYVQEIGRAGRADEAVMSYVIYLQPCDENIPKALISRESGISNLARQFRGVKNDYTDCYDKLTNRIGSKEELLENVMVVYHELSSGGKAEYVKTYSLDTAEQVKKYIYMLYAIGYVYDWWVFSSNENAGEIDIMIDVSSNDHKKYSGSGMMLKRVKERSVAYYNTYKDTREQIVLTQRAENVERVIEIYVEWYYSKFLYHHKEQFLDYLDFIETNRDCDNEKITEAIQEYFSLPFVEIKSDEVYYTGLSLSEIATKVAQGIGRKTLANIERVNSNRYSYNLDCMIFWSALKLDARFDSRRFQRITSNMSENQMDELRQACMKVFSRLSPPARLNFICGATSEPHLFGATPEEVCMMLYSKNEKDIVYYGFLAQRLNQCFN